MTHSERLFHFPVRVYDTASIANTQKSINDLLSKESKSEKLGLDIDDDDEEDVAYEFEKLMRTEPTSVVGQAAIPITDILGWKDDFAASRNVKEVEKAGFDMTKVLCKELGDLYCIWKRERFEAEYNKHYEALEAGGYLKK